MAPVKPMGINNPPQSKPGVTGFVQDYNDQPRPTQDLNPDAVTNPDALPKPLPAPKTPKVPKAPRKSRK